MKIRGNRAIYIFRDEFYYDSSNTVIIKDLFEKWMGMEPPEIGNELEEGEHIFYEFIETPKISYREIFLVNYDTQTCLGLLKKYKEFSNELLSSSNYLKYEI